MGDMDQHYRDLPMETAKHLSDILLMKGREALDISLELDKRLTNTNFLTNGGGAVATLTFLTTNSSIPSLKIALVLFTLGVVATGIELRALLKFFHTVHEDAIRRHCEFIGNSMTAREAGLGDEGVGRVYKQVNSFAGYFSQLCFISGVLVGAYALLCHT